MRFFISLFVKPAPELFEEILTALSETRSMTLTRIAREMRVREQDAMCVLELLASIGLVRSKGGTFAIDPLLRELILSTS